MLRVSYLEIYKEKIRDLLATVDDGAPPSIVEDPEVRASRHQYVTVMRKLTVF